MRRLDRFITDDFRVLEYLYRNKNADDKVSATQQEIAEDVGLGRTTVNGILQGLKRDGYLQSDGEHRGRYVLTAKTLMLVKHMQKIENILEIFN